MEKKNQRTIERDLEKAYKRYRSDWTLGKSRAERYLRQIKQLGEQLEAAIHDRNLIRQAYGK